MEQSASLKLLLKKPLYKDFLWIASWPNEVMKTHSQGINFLIDSLLRFWLKNYVTLKDSQLYI